MKNKFINNNSKPDVVWWKGTGVRETGVKEAGRDWHPKDIGSRQNSKDGNRSKGSGDSQTPRGCRRYRQPRGSGSRLD